MSPSPNAHDLITMGRSSIDLYADEVGVPFPEIEHFAAYVGGSPTNIGVGATRLGLDAAILTAVGEDPVGDFILSFLEEEGVQTGYIPRKPGRRTSAVVLGIEPPDRFPLVYYRENCADAALDIDDVEATPIAEAGALEFAGTNLSVEPSRSATLFAAETAREADVPVVFDLDFRPDQWEDSRAYGVAVRSAVGMADLVLGTEDELNAAVLDRSDQVELTHSQVSDARVEGDARGAALRLLERGPEAVIEKRGESGARIHRSGAEPEEVAGYPVDVHNILGAGDAFAAGFLYGFVNGWDLHRSARLGNACGAIVVTRHGCANFMPTLEEARSFAEERGGL